MSELPFKNLASAREEYAKVSEELAATKGRLAGVEGLEIENSDLKLQLETATKALSDGVSVLAGRDEALVNSEALIRAKDAEIKALKGDVAVLTVKCADLEKNHKSARAQARELVAAAAGPPAPVDNSEMEMTQKDLTRAMLVETDQTKLNALYRQFKKQQAAGNS